MTIEIKDGILKIRDREVYLFGGEVQYFRIRDKAYDAANTHGKWAETLDMMAGAGMNLVTCYVPWDYHEIKRDAFDFEGARDLDRFLGMCYERELHVQVKPGPCITAEWPLGPRTFGAVPLWLKTESPETLALTPSGRKFNVDPLKTKWGRQCTFLHPLYLDRVRKWYGAVAPIFLKYIHEKPCIWSLQIDNETNLFWNDHYLVDYSPTAITHYREFLKKRYSDIGELNAKYGSRYRSFSEVNPPKKPRIREFRGKSIENAPHIDWYEAGWAYVEEYLLTLRGMIEGLGIREPDVLFTTNDTPALTPRLNRMILFWRGAMKNKAGLAALDSYPRSDPLSRQLDDFPYQTDSSAALYDFYGDAYPLKHGSWVMGAEMQGGIFDVPIAKIIVRPEETARQMTRGLGGGIKAYAVYVMRDGYNLNKAFPSQAPIAENGNASARFHVLACGASKLVKPYGKDLNRAVAVESPVVVLTNSDYQVPLPGARLSTIHLWHTSYGGAYGWLKRSGYPPSMADIKHLDSEKLKRWKAALYIGPGLIGPREADILADYLEDGGTLIYQGWPPEADLSGRSSAALRRWADILPNRFVYLYTSGTRLSLSSDNKLYDFTTYAPFSLWEVPGDNIEIFLKAPSGGWCAYRRPYGKGQVIFISSDISRVFNTSTLYKLPEEDLQARRLLMKTIMDMAGIDRSMDWTPAKTEVWARKTPSGKLFLFCLNDGEPTSMTVRPSLPEALGLKYDKYYSIKRIYSGEELPVRSGKQIIDDGILLPMKKWGSEVILLEPRE